MKTTSTEKQIDAIKSALAKLYIRPFDCKSCDPKYNAQRNLSGITHYVEDDTLKWHHSRISSSNALFGGLLFRCVMSDSLDMHNTKRGFRAVVHDVFGTCVSRPELENAFPTSAKALSASEAESIDLVAHYRKAIAEQMTRAQDKLNELKEAAALIY
jgi:hypothetical protein